MSRGTILFTAVFSALNAVLAVIAFLFAGFATAPDLTDATMRLGFYALNGLCVLAAVCAVAPGLLLRRGRPRAAVVAAVLPTVTTILLVAAFLLLDSWIRRTFG